MAMQQTGGAFGFSGIDYGASSILTGWAENEADTANQRSQAAAQKQMDFEKEMSNTSWQRGTKDMLAAGINPMLAFQQGGASSPHGSSYTAPMARPVQSDVNANSSYQLQTAAQTDLLNAQTSKTKAEEESIRATYPVTVNSLQQQIAESQKRIEEITASVKAKTASAAQSEQQTRNLQAQLPLIQADIKRTLEQARNLAASTTQTGVETQRIQQLVQQNLPQLQRATEALDLVIKQMSIPGHMADEAAQSSFTGQLGAYANTLKALLPFGGIILAPGKGRPREQPRIEIPSTRGGQIVVPQHRR